MEENGGGGGMAFSPIDEGFVAFPPPAAFFLDVTLFVAESTSVGTVSPTLEGFRGEARDPADAAEEAAEALGAITTAATS